MFLRIIRKKLRKIQKKCRIIRAAQNFDLDFGDIFIIIGNPIVKNMNFHRNSRNHQKSFKNTQKA